MTDDPSEASAIEHRESRRPSREEAGASRTHRSVRARRIASFYGLAALALSCTPGCSHRTGAVDHLPNESTLRYDLDVEPDRRRLRVRICSDGPLPARLVPGPGGEMRALVRARHRDAMGRLRPVSVASAAIVLSHPAAGGCLELHLDPGRAVSGNTAGIDRAVVIPGGVWLWRPAAYVPTHASVRVPIRRGAEARLSVPWTDGHGEWHRLGPTAFLLPSRTVVGSHRHLESTTSGTRIRIARLPGPMQATDAEIVSWITDATSCVARLARRPVARHLLVVVAPVRGSRDPVAFGHVTRGGPSVLLLVDERAGAAALRRDWVAVHELVHLLLPPVRRDDALLPEGIATYYQELLRARCGLISAQEGRAALAQGFERGRRAATGRTLGEESRDMYATGAFVRVYWAGAAIAALADRELRSAASTADPTRRAHAGPSPRSACRSLDDAIAAIAPEASRVTRAWTAWELADALDRRCGRRVMRPLLERWWSSSEFPPVPEPSEIVSSE
ncbi:MAG: hypothetical protein NZ898_05660 [Myxococcota bacterium]|nr:hypothetical protein [Myxococcota bacterium]MDW8362399.1 hypothetical protein [Myxococcales bacterium]